MALPDRRVGLPEQLLPRRVLQADGLGTVRVHRKAQKFVLNGRLHFQYLLCPSYFPGPAVSSILPRVPKIKPPSHACTNRHWAKAFTPWGKISPDRGKPLFGSTISMLCLLQQGCASGRVTTKVVPFSLLLSTVTLPPCSTAISRTRQGQAPRRPSPGCGTYPPGKGWKMLSRQSAGMPGPVSAMRSTAVCFSRRRVTRTAPSRRLYLIPFSTRLNTSR